LRGGDDTFLSDFFSGSPLSALRSASLDFSPPFFFLSFFLSLDLDLLESELLELESLLLSEELLELLSFLFLFVFLVVFLDLRSSSESLLLDDDEELLAAAFFFLSSSFLSPPEVGPAIVLR